MGAPTWVVHYVNLPNGEDALLELAEDLTDRQLARFKGQAKRLADNGEALDGDYFDKVENSQRRLREFRVTAEGVEIRFLYKLRGRTFVMLKGYKHKKRRDVEKHIPAAEHRLDEWDKNHEPE